MTRSNVDQLRRQLRELQHTQSCSSRSSSTHGPVTSVKKSTFTASVCRRVVKFKRPSRAPLTFWSDKLAGLDILRRQDLTDTVDVDGKSYPLAIVVWTVPHDESVRLIISLSITIIPHVRKLITTDLGRVCPHCGSNEHIRSELDFHVKTVRDRLSRHKSDYNEYCERCLIHSTDGQAIIA